jgi:hypothetical protein
MFDKILQETITILGMVVLMVVVVLIGELLYTV